MMKFIRKNLYFALFLIGVNAIVVCNVLAAPTESTSSPDTEQITHLCQNITPTQRTLAQANGIDVDSICQTNSVDKGSNDRRVTIRPRSDKHETMKQRNSLTLQSSAEQILPAHQATSDDLEFIKQLKSINAQQFNVDGQEPELKPFGYTLFAGEPTSFEPATDIPVPMDYVIGPGDHLKIFVFGKETKTLNARVTREGRISIPDVGVLPVGGMTFANVQKLIQKTLKQKIIGAADILVTLAKLRTIRVFVLGDAYQPGSYVVSALSTMSHVLTVSGGIRETGSLRKVQLKRAGKIITELDLYDFLLKGDTKNDARVQAGDAVFIAPVGSTVAISGEVVRPAIYELKNEKTLAEVLGLAGGLTPKAFPKSIQITRKDKTSGLKTAFSVDLTTRKGKAFKIENGDEIKVYGVAEDKTGVVRVVGHVYQEREYGWHKGMRLSDVLPTIQQLKPDPELAIAIIMREQSATRQIFPMYVYPNSVIESPDSDTNVYLQPNDTLILLGHSEPREELLAPYIEQLTAQASKNAPKRLATITGAVRFPGIYPLAQNASALDLVHLAGGFAESAQTEKAELSRQIVYPDHSADIEHRNFDWKRPPKLLPGDAINVPSIGRFGVKRHVEIRGEVLSPGKYVIRDGETIKELIERTGGLTKKAFPEGAIFSRARLRKLEEQALAQLEAQLKQEQVAQQISAENANQSVRAKDDNTDEKIASLLDETKPIGRMVIDLPAILSGKAEDLVLDDGDVIIIPPQPDSITVLGQVQYPTSHVYDPTVTVTEYIQRSGGLTYNADESRIFIIHANGSVSLPKQGGWFGSEIALQPGDAIVVPIDLDYMKPLDLWTSVTQIIYQSAVAIAAAGSL